MSDKVEKAVDMLQEEYAKAKQQAYIRKPMSYALYETWKKFDKMEKVRGRLIDKDALIEEIERTTFITKELDNVFEAIENAPIVEDRPKGKWIEVETPKGYVQKYQCSNCGDDGGYIDMNFCPECGSDMRKEE